MRNTENKELRDFEIKQWFSILTKAYVKKGFGIRKSITMTYEIIGIRFSLGKESIRKAKQTKNTPNDSASLILDVKYNISVMKEAILEIEKAIDEQR